jgi:hypothetical protein
VTLIPSPIVEILETGTVGRLSVHNRSPKKPLFIQLGELLKGGLQDRTIATDLVLDPGEQYDGLPVYCVEQARWSKRHEEDHKKFVSTQDFVVTKPLRSSLERGKDQQSVWAAVASAKTRMACTLPGYLGSKVSPSSLQLSLEDSTLQKNIQHWRQEELAVNAKQISDLGRELYETLNKSSEGNKDKQDWFQ